jgi:hypothetical protein
MAGCSSIASYSTRQGAGSAALWRWRARHRSGRSHQEEGSSVLARQTSLGREPVLGCHEPIGLCLQRDALRALFNAR